MLSDSLIIGQMDDLFNVGLQVLQSYPFLGDAILIAVKGNSVVETVV
jgi:hypothetical protein